MAKAPAPVTSPPPVPGQPYDAAAPGTGDAQSGAEHVYDAAGSTAGAWVKVQEGGAADFRTGQVTGKWPGNGTSSAGPWRQA